MLAVIVGGGLVLTQLMGDPASANKPEVKDKAPQATSVAATEPETERLISTPVKSTE